MHYTLSGRATCNPRWPIKIAAAAEKALKEYKELHPDVRDEDIRVELPPPPNRRPPQALPGRPPRLPQPPAYVQVHHANNAHVPIAHPVVALPFAHGMPAFDFDRVFANGLPGFGEFGQRAAPENGAQMMFPPVGGFNPLLPPIPMPPLPPVPPLQQALAPMHMALGEALRMAGRRQQR